MSRPVTLDSLTSKRLVGEFSIAEISMSGTIKVKSYLAGNLQVECCEQTHIIPGAAVLAHISAGKLEVLP